MLPRFWHPHIKVDENDKIRLKMAATGYLQQEAQQLLSYHGKHEVKLALKSINNLGGSQDRGAHWSTITRKNSKTS